MLTVKETQLLNRVGPATIMGSYLRTQWLPVLESAELPPGGRPIQVRLLGEELVVYRAPGGELGLVGAWCSHSNAPMAYAANEADGLFCGSHGWKFDRAGRCISGGGAYWAGELDESFRLPAYPCVEREGVVFAYMGVRQGEPAPEMRNPHWLPSIALQSEAPYPQEPVAPRRFLRVHKVRWYRAIEAEIHTSVEGEIDLAFEMPWGLTRRVAPSGPALTHLWVPTDDDHTLEWVIEDRAFPAGALVSASVPEYLPERRGWFYANRWPVTSLDVPPPPTAAYGASAIEPGEQQSPADAAATDVLRQLVDAARALRERGILVDG